ncbi:MAG: hypothetical protein RM021_030675 [Nostoc sp. EkiNYC01]|nr:hypothetical protein [Nostoc sp. EkiNYC01]
MPCQTLPFFAVSCQKLPQFLLQNGRDRQENRTGERAAKEEGDKGNDIQERRSPIIARYPTTQAAHRQR